MRKSLLIMALMFFALSSLVFADQPAFEQVGKKNFTASEIFNPAGNIIKNPVAAARVADVFAKIEARQKEKIEMLEEQTVEEDSEGNLYVKGKEKVKIFGIIPTNARIEYAVSPEGAVLKKPRWFDNFITKGE